MNTKKWLLRIVCGVAVVTLVWIASSKQPQDPYANATPEVRAAMLEVTLARHSLNVQRVLLKWAEKSGADDSESRDQRLLVKCREHELAVCESLLGMTILKEETEMLASYARITSESTQL